jgi:hypothetical protein
MHAFILLQPVTRNYLRIIIGISQIYFMGYLLILPAILQIGSRMILDKDVFLLVIARLDRGIQKACRVLDTPVKPGYNDFLAVSVPWPE